MHGRKALLGREHGFLQKLLGVCDWRLRGLVWEWQEMTSEREVAEISLVMIIRTFILREMKIQWVLKV